MTDLPIDQQILLEAVAEAMATRSAEHRAEYEQELAALREKIAKLEGQIDVLMSLMQGKRADDRFTATAEEEACRLKIARSFPLTPITAERAHQHGCSRSFEASETVRKLLVR